MTPGPVSRRVVVGQQVGRLWIEAAQEGGGEERLGEAGRPGWAGRCLGGSLGCMVCSCPGPRVLTMDS